MVSSSVRRTEVASLAEQVESQSKELSTLRNRTLLSQENFGKEKEELLEREAFAEEQFEAAIFSFSKRVTVLFARHACSQKALNFVKCVRRVSYI